MTFKIPLSYSYYVWLLQLNLTSENDIVTSFYLPFCIKNSSYAFDR